MTLNLEALAPGDLANDVLQKFRLTAEARNVRLEVVAPPGLPQVDADPALLERVFDNLVGNALQHTPEGGSVSVRLAAVEARLRVHVEDTGCGIAASDVPFVFERHWRPSDPARRTPGGAGLGLAIARRILELHGRSIRVESEEGNGTRFSFSLPCTVRSAPA